MKPIFDKKLIERGCILEMNASYGFCKQGIPAPILTPYRIESPRNTLVLPAAFFAQIYRAEV